MQRYLSTAKNAGSQIVRRHRNSNFRPPPCDVFVNHRGIDTKRNVAGLLYDHLRRAGLRPFLDSKNMKPGDKLFEKIDPAIRGCKVGVAVLSPQYCDSYFCLHELALMMEWRKRVIPVFCDVKPSELAVADKWNGVYPAEDLERFRLALEEAKYTVGLTFDTLNGDWSNFLVCATEAVVKNLIEVEGNEWIKRHKYYHRGHNIKF
ncbi:PREDICTED: probable disease resistance protein RPP1 [Ipomoea nil]|uniref:probable disease resistance protein RPP1 n=1 Tax=Ipomoea nil TaxID=35883 RepID=UPI0009009FC5|nr:PREDICTED: probable disease resistance protein RPP1 [Ipomoea nil]